MPGHSLPTQSQLVENIGIIQVEGSLKFARKLIYLVNLALRMNCQFYFFDGLCSQKGHF